MSVSNLRRKNVDNALANYVMEQLKSIYLYPNVLVVGLYQTHWNKITELESITFVSITSVSCVRFASGNYLFKPYKWDKENVMIMFRIYVITALKRYVRLTLRSYVIKLCLWIQKVTQ